MEIANKFTRKLFTVLEAKDHDWVVRDLFAKKSVIAILAQKVNLFIICLSSFLYLKSLKSFTPII